MRYATALLLLLLMACGQPKCNNTNPVFDKYPVASKEYQLELVKQLGSRNEGELRFWIDKYMESGGKEYLLIDIQGKGLCAKGMMHVSEWGNMQAVKNGKGGGYHGAELKGLRYTLNTDTTAPGMEYLYAEGVED